MRYFYLLLISAFIGGLLWEKIPTRLRYWLLLGGCLLLIVLVFFFRKL